MKAIKFGFFKWLPTGVGILGLGALLHRMASETEAGELLVGVILVAAVSLGLQIYGEVRRAQAMAAQHSSV